ncbi:thioredoxin-like domain-containing protein [Candidatus Nitrosotalea okcheonensis]|uniref:Alkyl hydroperoxide reductase/ Thiol specific antioxidant/ Mal allergen n=1 Tax=Candidatus Nitrosotalea okcheonensis TaxID=1903276 RepID=A0A2H1FFH8_9ARCH|nr:thioredoxin-like domain-containing protein [Candidatus Nitrosotalea okcheonensis]SMH71521.1 Alkyl hydroperoxide reductase/ Thiol specific antioxidant/ Mal allergen [Candidatus Nitrosotalea okcheonensis]
MFDNIFSKVTKAPEFPPEFNWVNTKEPLSLEKLRGHVIVLDFWTYCCINCMHTLPILAELEKKYSDMPVVFIGVHSAKFFNEQDRKNIEQAVARYEISHPVLVDEKMAVWNKFGINGWPTIAIIDPNGILVYRQSGEGQKEMIEDTIDVILEKHERSHTLAREPIKIAKTIKKSSATLSFPGKISVSKDMIAISDSNHNRVIVTDLSGKVLHIIGSGKIGLEDGKFTDAAFFRPQGVVWKDDFIFVADTENHALRKIDLQNNHVTTLVGTGKQGPWRSSGGRGKEVSISSPWDVAVKDDLVFIAMAGNHQIWVYDINTDLTKPFAGNGQEDIIDGNRMQAHLAQPSGIFIHDDTIYFVDSETSSVREIDLKTQYVRTIAGHGLFAFGYKDGKISESLFQHSLGLCVTTNKIFVADTYNSSIRVIDQKNDSVMTLIGKQGMSTTCRLDDPSCDTLELYEPSDVKWYQDKLYIADTNNHIIRVYDLMTNILETLDIQI